MSYLSIDRIEGEVAICEDENRTRIELPLKEISGSPKEGDIILCAEGVYRVSKEETDRRRAEILRLQQQLFSADE